MRLQLALRVRDLDAAVNFYAKMFGVSANKRKPGYANFSIADPPLKLVLFEASQAAERLHHLGVEIVPNDDGECDEEDIKAAAKRLQSGGVSHAMETGETCCWAKQNKVVTADPDGTMWEWYRVVEDTDSFGGRSAEPGCCGPQTPMASC